VQKDRVRARVWVQAVGAAGLLVGTGLGPQAVAQQAYSTTGTVSPRALPMELRVRRVRDGVEVVIENTGSAPQLEQTNQGGSWLGRLTTSRPAVLLRGPQTVALPEAGVRSLSIEGSGTVFTLRAMAVGGTPMRPPLVSADGRNVVLSFAAPLQATLQTTQRNSLAPGAVANPNFVPPLRARATAPPVGDMAVGTMVLKNPNYLNVRGPRVTLTFKGVPASNALQALARLGGYGFVYKMSLSGGQPASGEANDAQAKSGQFQTSQLNPPVTASFIGEDYTSAINLVLASTGLQARLTGNTVVAGQDLFSLNTGNFISKIYRLNQASAMGAAEYLATLGARIRVPNTSVKTESQGNSTGTGSASGSQGVAQAGSQSSTSISSTTGASTVIKEFGASSGPLVGLGGTTDPRLGTITLVGIPALVSIGEQYLKQIDIRQRQVALSIRILDVSLGNDAQIENSFAFRYGNNFIVNQQGQLVANFGALKPPSSPDGGLPGFFNGVDGSPIVGAGRFKLPGSPGPGNTFLSPSPLFPGSGGVAPGAPTPFYNPNYFARPGFGAYDNPGQPGITGFEKPETITLPNGEVKQVPGQAQYAAPQAFQYPQDKLFDFVKAVVQSSTTKVLASPTLILTEATDYDSAESNGGGNSQAGGGGSSQGAGGGSFSINNTSTNEFVKKIGRDRGNQSAVVVGEQVVTSFNVQAGQNGAPNTCQPVLGVAGLTFGAQVLKIDDNGFVTFKISPAISATTRREFVQGCGLIDILALRSLDTGNARVRDGQTLILTGVLSDRDIQEVRKWPIFGDLPLVGQFFRQSSNSRQKRELVVMVTPRIINDAEGGSYGYGFEPSSSDSRRFMNSSPSSAMPGFMTQP